MEGTRGGRGSSSVESNSAEGREVGASVRRARRPFSLVSIRALLHEEELPKVFLVM